MALLDAGPADTTGIAWPMTMGSLIIAGTGGGSVIPIHAKDLEAAPTVDHPAFHAKFTSGLENTHGYKHVARVDPGDKANYRWTTHSPLELFGGGAVLKIDPVTKVEKMEFALKLDCKTSGKPVDFTIESGDPANPTQLFDSKQHEIWMSPAGSSEILRLAPPDGVEKTRITNHSERAKVCCSMSSPSSRKSEPAARPEGVTHSKGSNLIIF